MDAYEKLIQAKGLLDKGIINEAEYSEIKNALLKEIENGKVESPKQDKEISYNEQKKETTNDVGASGGTKLISLLLPIVGIILFIMDNNERPQKAKDEITFALIGFAIGAILVVMSSIIWGSLLYHY